MKIQDVVFKPKSVRIYGVIRLISDYSEIDNKREI